jgi:hypothetical protein
MRPTVCVGPLPSAARIAAAVGPTAPAWKTLPPLTAASVASCTALDGSGR